MIVKQCRLCKEEKEFKARKDGYYNSYCTICHNKLYTINRNKKIDIYRKKQNERDRQKSREIYCLKGMIGCCRCPERDPRSLDFHHKNPNEKIEQVSTIWREHGQQAGLKEAAKCEVICGNCHKKEHTKLRLEENERFDPILGDHI
jgi:hypothetical protein